KIVVFLSILLGLCLFFLIVLTFLPNISDAVGSIGKLTIEEKFDRYQKEQLSKFTSARDTWSRRGIDNYRLQIEVTPRLESYGANSAMESPSCFLESEVQKGSSAKLVGSTCSTCGYLLPATDYVMFEFITEQFNLFRNLNALTVDQMFNRISVLFREPWCGPNGCECDGFYAYDVDYDPDLGYPTSMKLIYQKPNPTGFCTLIGTEFLAPEYKITLVQPPYEDQPIGITSALTPQEIQGEIGETLDLHDFSILVTKVVAGPDSPVGWPPEPGRKFVTVYVTITSKRSEAYDVSIDNALLYDSNGKVYYPFAMMGKPRNFPAEPEFVFGVPENAHGFTLKYKVPCSAWNEQVIFILGE
ncbi:MAG: hypothetical protein AB1750_11640, partial [Chloroflexota bacterium]